jgi:hypothetical protein
MFKSLILNGYVGFTVWAELFLAEPFLLSFTMITLCGCVVSLGVLGAKSALE